MSARRQKDRQPETNSLHPAPVDILPHRPPFLFIDRILELDPGRRAVATWVARDVSGGEWFRGHFPGRPVLPGVLIIEAMAQAGAVAVLADPARRDRIPFFAGIDGGRFRRPVRPGDELRLEVELVHLGTRAGKGRGVAVVAGQTAAEADLTFVLIPREA